MSSNGDHLLGGSIMTIAVALRTSTAAVFAADSKLTTNALVGFDADGNPLFLPQTYDNATKIVRDSSGTAMAIVAGSIALGPISVMDYLASSAVPRATNPEEQNRLINEFVGGIARLRAAVWHELKVQEDKWPAAVIMLAVASPAAREPLVWRIVLAGADPTISRVLLSPGVWLEGSYDSAFSLLYGYHPDVVQALGRQLTADGKTIGEDAIYGALGAAAVLLPRDKLSLPGMPIQDAVDLGCFLASVQIQMERFLPGNPVCGGPIDVMVLKTAPNQEILWLPGKALRHPVSGVPG